MVTSKKDQNNQEISRQKPTRGDPYKIRTTGKGNEHLPALIPLRRGLVKGPCLKTKTIITKDFLLSKVSNSFYIHKVRVRSCVSSPFSRCTPILD